MQLMAHIEHLFAQQAQSTGEKRGRLIINTGIDPTQFRAYERAGRPLSDDMLQRIAKTYPDNTSLDKLRALKALDQYGAAVILKAHQIIHAEMANEPSEMALTLKVPRVC